MSTSLQDMSIISTYPSEFHIKHMFVTGLYRVRMEISNLPDLIAYWGNGNIYYAWENQSRVGTIIDRTAWDSPVMAQCYDLIEQLEFTPGGPRSFSSSEVRDFVSVLALTTLTIYNDVQAGNIITTPSHGLNPVRVNARAIMHGDELALVLPGKAFPSTVTSPVLALDNRTQREDIMALVSESLDPAWGGEEITREHLVDQIAEEGMEIFNMTV